MASPQCPSLFVLDPYHDAAIAKLQQCSTINLVTPDEDRRADYLDKADALLVRSDTRLSAEVLARAGPKLRFIVKQGAGVDNVDLQAAAKKGIQVFNTAGINSEAVAELTIGLAFCVARRINEIDRQIRHGKNVVRSRTLGTSLFKKVIGIIGMGNIGLEVARKWHGAMTGSIVAFDPYAKEQAWMDEFPSKAFRRASKLEDLLGSSDVVSVHVPLTADTANLLSEKELSMMRKGAILLNCARGGVVDEDALLEALNSDHLFGAGLDASRHEPPSRDVYGATLLSHPRVVMTGHIGASTEENQRSSGVLAAHIALDLLENGWTDKSKSLN